MKKYIAVAVLMLAVILSGCGGSKSASTSKPPLNWDGLYLGTADSGYNTWTLNISGNSPSYFASLDLPAAGFPGCENTYNVTTDSWDSSQTSNVILAGGNCGGASGESQEWKLSGKTITITFTASGNIAVFTKQ
jgi:uncharacterized protein YceK